MKKLIVVFVCVCSVIMLTACGAPPKEQIDAAKNLVNSVSSEAEVYAPDSLKAAQNKMAALDAEISTQEGKFFKSWKATTQLAIELKAAAEKAKLDAEEGKIRAKNEAEAALVETETAIAAAREMLAKAPTGKGTTADLAALTGDVDAAAASLESAKALILEEKYAEVKTAAVSSKEMADRVVAEIEAAIEMISAKK